MGSAKATPECCAGADRRGESQVSCCASGDPIRLVFQIEVADDAPADVAVEHLVERGPDIFMDAMEERSARDKALKEYV